MLRRSTSLTFALATLASLVALTGFTAGSAAAQTRYSINITSTPDGATVFLDSTSSPALGVTPMRRTPVARGNHSFIFRKEGYADTTVTVAVTRYGQTVTAALTQLARLQITAADDSAQGATVSIDGENRGTVPYNDFIRPDRVQVVVTREGYRPADQWVTLSPGQVFAWPVRLERNAPRTGSLAVFADVRGAPVFIDGTQRCQTPCTTNDVAEGPHLVEIRPTQEGARPFTQQVTVVAGQTATVDAQIEMAPQTGSLRVLCSAAGATISIDGEPVGPSPATRDRLSPGDHIVEVTAAGFQRSQQTVTITAGQQRVISVDLSAVAATTGTLRVIGSPTGATVTIDGEPVGTLPTSASSVAAGDHIVEVTMQGYVANTQTVSVTAGQQRVVSVTLSESPREPGRILVQANVPGATVLIDQNGPFQVPYAQDRAPVGTHTVVVRAAGYTEFSQTCTVGPGQDCRIDATLEGARIPLRVQVQTDVTGAHLFIDGVDAGALPFNGQVGVGQHRFEIRAEGYRDSVENRDVHDGEPPIFMQVQLRRQNELTEEEVAERDRRREADMRRAFTRTGANLPADLANIELLAGWPYLAEMRLNMGVHEHADVGMTFRTVGRLTEFLARGRAGWRPSSRYSIGGQIQVGGGIGPTRTAGGCMGCKTNSFTMNADLLFSLHLSRAGAFTFNLGLDINSDLWSFQLADRDTPYANGNRQLTAHGRFGATLEVALANHDSLMFSAQGIMGPSRRIMGDLFGIDGIHYEDKLIGMHTQLQIGWMHKFNWRWEDEEL